MTEWTEDQKKAIEHRGHDILVSAAAGSGKTTILIERILRELKGDSEYQPEDIDNLLVVTFTDAAAQEMKERLLTALKSEVKKDVDSETKKHLQRQIFRVAMANISTIHAFCLSVIKKFYYVIDLDPNFRLLSDDTEKSIIQEQAYDIVRDDYYSSGDVDFIKLTDNFTNDRSDDGLKDIVYNTYNFAIANRDTQAWLDNLITLYQFDDSFVNTEFYREDFLSQVKERLDQLEELNDTGIDLANSDPLAGSYSKVFDERKTKLENLKQNLTHISYQDLREEIDTFPLENKKDTVKKDQKAGKDLGPMNAAAKNGSDFNAGLKKLYQDYFIKSENEVNDTMIQAQKLVTKLVEFERRFMDKFDDLKSQRHVLDFNDLEHKAVEILTGEVDGRRIAQEYYQNKFHELMIDEYQDVNEMQDRIIDLLSCDTNHRFMVGDIKQSIYGFRQAAPRLFTEKYDRFKQAENPNELVQLSMNFRSSRAVDDFVNQIFTRIFDKKIGDIDYNDDAKLIMGTKFPKNVDTVNELNVYALPDSSEDKSKYNDPEENIINDEAEQAETEKRQILIHAAADKIQELVSSGFEIYDSKLKTDNEADKVRPIRYSDIAILARTHSNNTDIISYFSKVNVPIMVTNAQNYFQTTELQIMMAMLNIVDNPYQDIPLVAVLRSPIVGLNEEELAQIRLTDKRNTYFTAVNEYLQADNADQHIKNKLQSFLLQLTNYRDFSNKNSIARLIWKIYQETGLLEYVSGMPGGKQRGANLHALYQRANSYEENNFKGLHQFINFIQQMQDMDKDLSQPNSIEANDDTVKVMTVHGSKGLEFPVVIYLDIANQFNMRSVYDNTVFDARKGIGITISDTLSRLQYRTIQRGVISNQKHLATVSEEMRLLYVALTRAKQKLIMLGFTKDQDKMFKIWDNIKMDAQGRINESARKKALSFQNLIGMSTLSDVDTDEYFDENIQLRFKLIPTTSITTETNSIILSKPIPQVPSQLFKDTVDGILDFDYKYQPAVETTAYQSVSEIKGLFADPDDEGMGEYHETNETSRYNLGSFAKPDFLTKSKKITSAEVGSATHLVLQKISIEETPSLTDFEQLVNEMVNEKLLTSQLAEKIDLEQLVNFYQSDLGQQIVANHGNVSREFPCSILMPADNLFKNTSKDYSTNDKILVHGIIDGVIELADGIIIFDYKTDHVTDENKHELVSKYSGQVNLYADAISVIKNKPVVGKYLYFLKINQAISIK